MITWWYSRFSDEIQSLISKTIDKRSFSQGHGVQLFEENLCEVLGYQRCVCVTSGTAALTLGMAYLGVRPTTSVVVPDRTWIATSHAAKMLGADVLVAPVCDRLLLDLTQLSNLLTGNVSCLAPVFMNGRLFNPSDLTAHLPSDIPVIYDCAQAFGSCFSNGEHLSSAVDFGAYSLSVAKTISSGQGGFLGINDPDVARDISSLRTHGLENVIEPSEWPLLGFNFRMTDLTAAVGLCQLRQYPAKVAGLCHTYQLYQDSLLKLRDYISLIPVDIEHGEVPQYVEVTSPSASELRTFLHDRGIQTRGFFPPVSSAPYVLNKDLDIFPSFDNSSKFILPSGPDRDPAEILTVCQAIETFFAQRLCLNS